MANVTITLVVPAERLDAVYAAAAAPVGVAPAPADAADDTDWLDLAPKLLDDTMGLEPMDLEPIGLERRLLRRLAEARAQRVPIAELVRDFGLPPHSSLAQDFPCLTAFCDADPTNRRFPVVAGGDGSAGWYWMAVVDAAAFESAFRDKDGEPAAQ